MSKNLIRDRKKKMKALKVVVRSANAGAFYGDLVKAKSDKAGTAKVTLKNARRIWYWAGAASLSELATKGVTQPDECKFPMRTEGMHVIYGVCEIIPVTKRALKSLDGVPVWAAKRGSPNE